MQLKAGAGLGGATAFPLKVSFHRKMSKDLCLKVKVQQEHLPRIRESVAHSLKDLGLI